MYIETISEQYPILYARYNVWDHTDPADIMMFDIRDGSDSTGLVTVDFTPIGYLGGNNPGLDDNWHLFPNPTSGLFKITGSLPQPEFSRFEIIDLFGKVVKFFPGNLNAEGMEFDLSQSSAGVYFCRIYLEDKVFTKKLLIQK
ncbi:MAG: hypothetical protein CVU43_19180 [Chloroflexi bacterium HGW-Chloroflexi-5]|nr:MAG: hypothetical protein CVU43_19180 [Chloroflexi bacterium HGW-Chloroflexi-5]